MAKYKISDLKIGQGFLVGKVGFGITDTYLEFILKDLCEAYSKGSSKVVVGHDGSNWPSLFVFEVIIPFLCKRGVSVVGVNEPCILPQLSWLTKELSDSSKSNHVGVYVASDPECSDNVMLFFRDRKGHSLSEKELRSMLALKLTDEGYCYSPPEKVDPIYLDISLYPEYLKNAKLIDLDKSRSVKEVRTLTIDNMFGASEYFFNNNLAPVYSYVFSKASEYLSSKPVSYVAKPTGLNLKRNFKNRLEPGKLYHFAIDNIGSALGLYDCKQDLEISKSGMYMLLIYLYTKVLKKKGTILISKGLSKRVELLCVALGLKHEVIDSGMDSFTALVGKRKRHSYLLYGDEHGRFWFKGDVLDYNPIVALFRLTELCERLNQSPGEILDFISSKYSVPSMPYSSINIPSSLLDIEDLSEKIKSQYSAEIDNTEANTLIHNLDKDTRIYLQESQNKDNIEVYIESLDLGITKNIALYVESLISPKNYYTKPDTSSTLQQ